MSNQTDLHSGRQSPPPPPHSPTIVHDLIFPPRTFDHATHHVSIHHDNGNHIARGPPTRLRNEWLGFIYYCLSFQSEDNNAFVNTAGAMGRCQTENSCCFETAFGRKSSTFWKWRCLRKIALESKRLIHTWWTWCQITFNRIFYPIQQKSMVFNQESCWNNRSKSLHSFWATLYRPYGEYHAWQSVSLHNHTYNCVYVFPFPLDLPFPSSFLGTSPPPPPPPLPFSPPLSSLPLSLSLVHNVLALWHPGIPASWLMHSESPSRNVLKCILKFVYLQYTSNLIALWRCRLGKGLVWPRRLWRKPCIVRESTLLH